MSGGPAFFSLVQKSRQPMRKCSGSPIRSIPKNGCWSLQGIDISVDSTGINVKITVRVCSSRDRGERKFHADWDD